MKWIRIVILVIVCSLNLILKPSFAESLKLTSEVNDRVVLFTDRSLYIAGEKINFAAVVLNEVGEHSKLIYIELVTPEGQRISANKYPVSKRNASGDITIPNEILTGNYYIKAYTRWMRNFPLSGYFFLPVKIVNPNRLELLHLAQKTGEVDSSQHFFVISENKNIKITPDHPEYSKRQNAKISINAQSFSEIIQTGHLSIVPKASLSPNGSLRVIKTSNGAGSLLYQPEINGITLSGVISDKELNNPIPFMQVSLSVLGIHSDFIATRTDSLGIFTFNLPLLYGKNDLYIGAQEKINAKIVIDNDFCTREVQLPIIPFELSEAERLVVENMVKNVEVEKSFFDKKSNIVESGNQTIGCPFYGTPDNTFYFDKYINLLSVEEYFQELIPNVSVRKRSGKSRFIIHSNQPEIGVYDPLVLIDMIAIDQIDRILAANPNLLSRIDVVSKPYYKGDMIYGGIVSFFSQKGDLAGIDLPSSDMFLEFDFLTEPDTISPDLGMIPKNLPDTRNTILWIDHFDCPLPKTISIDFQTPDTPGDYTILLQGLTSKGEKFYSSSSFTIK